MIVLLVLVNTDEHSVKVTELGDERELLESKLEWLKFLGWSFLESEYVGVLESVINLVAGKDPEDLGAPELSPI